MLGKNDFALFDCSASLHGYQSDVTRVSEDPHTVKVVLNAPFQTVALPGSEIPKEHLKLWHDVHSAQRAAMSAAHEGVIAAQVDKAARSSLNNSKYFTHRLGHGPSPEESPSLSVDYFSLK